MDQVISSNEKKLPTKRGAKKRGRVAATKRPRPVEEDDEPEIDVTENGVVNGVANGEPQDLEQIVAQLCNILDQPADQKGLRTIIE